eukprot:GHUV01033376.1.p1 GENE.GHUV01033376.1~~GHUV01033376.1.p1  ORF type:complete len:175 (-),score=36.61 GHUV01033376.1:811-1335(-)
MMPFAEISSSSCCVVYSGIDQVSATMSFPSQVWKGTAKASEHQLLDVPVAITSFRTETAQPRLPTLAVAAGAHVYMFRNLRPYYKFTVPAENAPSAAEETVWYVVVHLAVCSADVLMLARSHNGPRTQQSLAQGSQAAVNNTAGPAAGLPHETLGLQSSGSSPPHICIGLLQSH